MRQLLFIAFLVFNFCASAQKMKLPVYREIIIVTPSLTMKFNVKAKKQKKALKPKDRCSYTWYFNDKLQTTQGGFDGLLLDGTYREYDSKNRLIGQGEYKQGMKIGEWKAWHTNGKYKQVSFWKKGVLKKELNYNDSGAVIGHFVYCKKGKLDLLEKERLKQEKKTEKKKAKEEKKKLKKESVKTKEETPNKAKKFSLKKLFTKKPKEVKENASPEPEKKKEKSSKKTKKESDPTPSK